MSLHFSDPSSFQPSPSLISPTVNVLEPGTESWGCWHTCRAQHLPTVAQARSCLWLFSRQPPKCGQIYIKIHPLLFTLVKYTHDVTQLSPPPMFIFPSQNCPCSTPPPHFLPPQLLTATVPLSAHRFDIPRSLLGLESRRICPFGGWFVSA